MYSKMTPLLVVTSLSMYTVTKPTPVTFCADDVHVTCVSDDCLWRCIMDTLRMKMSMVNINAGLTLLEIQIQSGQ